VPSRSPLLPLLLLLLPPVSLAGGAASATTADNGPWLNALTTAYVLVDMTTGDLDGDGADETALCYRRNMEATNTSGGVVVLRGKGEKAKPVFHVQLDRTQCEKLRINGRQLGLMLTGRRQLIWTYGQEIVFRGEKGSPLAGVSLKGSSTLNAGNAPARAFDNDLSTSWAEGASGTGIGQVLTLRFKAPIDIAAVAIVSGDNSNRRAFFDSNRVHRGSLEAKVEADMGDSAAGIDFATLGIDSIGDRVEFVCENRPEVTYVQVNKKGVIELNLRVESVYLGDKRDDTHVADLEIVPLLALDQTVDKARRMRPAAPPEGDVKVDDAQPGKEKERTALDKLDEGGRFIVTDDDL
jgi:hypothetical protein